MSPSGKTSPVTLVWFALLALLALSVASTLAPTPASRAAAGFGVAGAKAAVVMWWYMKMREEKGLVRLAAVAAFVWTAILLVLLAADYGTRL